jgi:hypothetical protein
MKLNNLKIKKMKKLFKNLLTIYFLFFSVQAVAQKEEKKRYEHFKEKDISKTYPAQGNKLRIDNNFGNVTVTSWDRNEIKVDIHIESSSDNKEVAEKVFNNIEVEESKSGNEIRFETKTEKAKNQNNSNCKSCNSKMSIDYEIHLPSNLPLTVYNHFGALTIPDYTGSVHLFSAFGSLTAGNLSKSEKVQVEFGKANIKSLSNATLTFKFSDITVENLAGANKIDMEFCKSGSIKVDNNLTSLSLNESYSTVNIRPTADFSATYDIRSNMGSVKDRSNANIKRTDKPQEYGPDSDKRYEGKSGSGGAKIQVNSTFGQIIIGQVTAGEMKEKENDKKNKEII